jgi:hypothetical protein
MLALVHPVEDSPKRQMTRNLQDRGLRSAGVGCVALSVTSRATDLPIRRAGHRPGESLETDMHPVTALS